MNPIRAGVATTPETSEYTSAFERIQAGTLVAAVDGKAVTGACDDQAVDRVGWLSPVELQAGLNAAAAPTGQPRVGPPRVTARRASAAATDWCRSGGCLVIRTRWVSGRWSSRHSAS